MMKYIAREKGWYCTSQMKKLWISSEQIDEVLAALWNIHSTREKDYCVQKLLSLHTVIQCLDVMGTRRLSLVDDGNRPRGHVGRYLRWGMITIQLLGYQGDEPEFVVSATASGTKHSARFGDAKFSNFAFATRDSNDALSSGRDVALGFIGLAVLQNAMGPKLLEVIRDKSAGVQLLAHSSTGYYLFHSLHGNEDCPVFVTSKLQHADGFKHHLDETTFHDNSMQPLTTRALDKMLFTCGQSIGLEETLTCGILRRTYSLKARANPALKEWQIVEKMCHDSGNPDIIRKIYRPTHMPVDAMSSRFGLSDASETAKKGLMQTGLMTKRPDRSRISDMTMEALIATREEQAKGTVTDEDLMVAYTKVNGGRRCSVEDVAFGIERLANGDNWRRAVDIKHPYISRCGNKLTNIIKFLVNGGLYACPSCSGPAHQSNASRSSPVRQFMLINKCYMRTHQLTYCVVCQTHIRIHDFGNHISNCLRAYTDRLANSTYTLHACTFVPGGLQPWEQVEFTICPFATCVDCPVTRSQSPRFGKTRLWIFDCIEQFQYHITRHLFTWDFDNGGHCTIGMRSTCENGRVLCEIYNCSETFANNDLGKKERLVHMLNTHKLPIFKDHADGYLKEIGSEHIEMLTFLPNPLRSSVKENDNYIYFLCNSANFKQKQQTAPASTKASKRKHITSDDDFM